MLLNKKYTIKQSFEAKILFSEFSPKRLLTGIRSHDITILLIELTIGKNLAALFFREMSGACKGGLIYLRKLTVGSPLIDALVHPLSGSEISLRDLTDRKKTAIFFLRDAACVLTQAYIQELIGAQEHGPQGHAYHRAGASSVLSPKKIPYEVICDSAGTLYTRYGVGSSPNREQLGDDSTMACIKNAYDAGFVHGTDTGDPLRLPALFLFNRSGCAAMVHYGVLGNDLPSAASLQEVLESLG